MKVRLSLHARKLKNIHSFRVSSPYATISNYTGDIRDAYVLGKTEVVKNCLDPMWVKSVLIDYEYAQSTQVKVSIFDQNSKKGSDGDKPMGTAVVFDVDKVLQNNRKQKRSGGGLVAKKCPGSGWIFLQAAIISENEEAKMLTLALKGSEFAGSSSGSGSSKLDTFFEICRKNEEPSGKSWARPVYRSEVVENSASPRWKKTAIELDWLCNSDEDREIQITIYEYKKSGRHAHIGTAITTVHALTKNNRIGISRGGNDEAGRLKIIEGRIVSKNDCDNYGPAANNFDGNDSMSTFRSVESAQSKASAFTQTSAYNQAAAKSKRSSIGYEKTKRSSISSRRSSMEHVPPPKPGTFSHISPVGKTRRTRSDVGTSSQRSSTSYKPTTRYGQQSSLTGSSTLPVGWRKPSSVEDNAPIVKQSSTVVMRRPSLESTPHVENPTESRDRSSSFEEVSPKSIIDYEEQSRGSTSARRSRRATMNFLPTTQSSQSADTTDPTAKTKMGERVLVAGRNRRATINFLPTTQSSQSADTTDPTAKTKMGERVLVAGVQYNAPKPRNEGQEEDWREEGYNSAIKAIKSIKKPERTRNISVASAATAPPTVPESKQRQRNSSTATNERISVELLLHAKDLKNLSRLAGVSDPYAVISLVDPSSGKNVRILGRTEVIDSSLDPVWCEATLIEYMTGTQLNINVTVYDKNENHEDKQMGSARFDVGSVLNSSTGMRAKRLDKGWLFVQAEQVPDAPEKFLTIVLEGSKLKNVEGILGGKSDPFFEVSKRDANGTWRAVYRSEHVENELEPKWKRAKVDFHRLCSSDASKPFRLAVYDYERSGKHKDMGWVETTVDGLIEAYGFDTPAKPLELKKDGKSFGFLVVKRAFVSSSGGERKSSIQHTIKHTFQPSASKKQERKKQPDPEQVAVERVESKEEANPANNLANIPSNYKTRAFETGNTEARPDAEEDWGSEYASYARGRKVVRKQDNNEQSVHQVEPLASSARDSNGPVRIDITRHDTDESTDVTNEEGHDRAKRGGLMRLLAGFGLSSEKLPDDDEAVVQSREAIDSIGTSLAQGAQIVDSKIRGQQQH